MQIRPQLYCDAKWYRNRSISECVLADPAFQIRPNLDELTILSQIGVLQPSTIAYDPGAPVMTQHVCSGFYGMGPVPKPVTKRRAVDEARTKPRKTTIAIQSSVKPYGSRMRPQEKLPRNPKTHVMIPPMPTSLL
jgi:hypothetical protein